MDHGFFNDYYALINRIATRSAVWRCCTAMLCYFCMSEQGILAAQAAPGSICPDCMFAALREARTAVATPCPVISDPEA